MKKILVALNPHIKATKEFLVGVSAFAHSHKGWILHLDDEPKSLTEETLKEYAQNGISGAIICETGVPNFDNILSTSPIPIVSFGSPKENVTSPASMVGYSMSDDEGIGSHAAEYLISLGKSRSYAFVPVLTDEGWSKNICNGFVEKLESEKKEVKIFDVYGEAPKHGIAKEINAAIYDKILEQWLVELPKPASILAACDELGLKVISAARSAGIKIPSQLLVMGVGNVSIIDELSVPSLTSIEVDHESEGANAADLLLRFINKTEKKNLKVVRSKAIKLIERESTNYIIPASHIIDKALDYITNNSTQKITIDSVARHLKISRRLLDMRFKQFHDKTVAETILGIRLNEVRKKLLTTSLPVKYIARAYGFENLQYLKILFKKHFHEELTRPKALTLKKDRRTPV